MTDTPTTLSTVDGRHQLRLERRLAHPVERVWPAITEPAQLSRWFPAQVELELRRGATVRYSMDPYQPDQEGTVLEVDPPRLLVMTWADNVLRLELEPDGDGCRLLFTQTFDDLAGAASFASGWDVCLGILEARLAGDEPAPPEAMDTAHEQQVAGLGLRVGTIEQTPSGWRVRIERQLVRPAEVVRPLLPVDDGNWELGEGTGHGARLVLTHDRLPDEVSARRVLDESHERVEAFAAALLDHR